MADLTTASQLWRFPVKSMGGHQVEELRIDERGDHADRLSAVRYGEGPGPDAGPGNDVRLTSLPPITDNSQHRLTVKQLTVDRPSTEYPGSTGVGATVEIGTARLHDSVLRVGDSVRVRRPAPPGAVRDTAATAGEAVARQVRWVIETTPLREA